LDDVIGKLEGGVFMPGGGFPTLTALCESYRISNITGRRVFRELQDRGHIATRGRRGTIVTRAPSRQTVYLCFRGECFVEGRQPLSSYSILHEIAMGLAGSKVSSLFDFVPVSLDFCLAHREQLAGHPVVACADVLFVIDGDEVRIDRELQAALQARFDPIYIHTVAELAGVPAVGTELGGHIAHPMRHLLARGHRRIGLLNGPSVSPWYRPRLQAYLDTLHEAGLPFAPELVRITSGRLPAEDHAAAAALLGLPEPPTALVCANDTRALTVMAYCQERGLRIPDDLAITGSDNRPEAAFSQPSLTTSDGRHREQGLLVADWLARRLAGEVLPPEPVLLPPRFIVRNSS